MRFRRSSLMAWGALALLAGAAAMLAVNLGTFAAVRASGNRATDALLRVETLLSIVKDAETGGRGYLLTGDEAYLGPYHQALRDIEEALAAAAAVAGDADRRRHLEAVGSRTRAKLEHLRGVVELRRTAGADAALAVIGTGEGQRLMQALRAEVSALQQSILRDRDAAQHREWWRAMSSAGLAFGAGALAALLLGLAVVLLRRTLASRDRSIEALLEERAGAEFERISAGVLLDALPVGVFLADASGRVVRTNAEAVRIWGGAPPGLGEGACHGYQGSRLDTGAPLVPGDWCLERALGSGETSLGEGIRIRRFDGGERVILDSAAPIRDAAGRLLGAVAIAQDITGRRQAEEALRASDRRVRELQAEFLHVARASEIGQMATTLAHELNQPLAAATNYINGSRRMLDGADPAARLAAVREALAAAAQQTIHAGQIIRRMRGFVARGDTDRRTEDLAEVVQGATELASFPARQRQAEIRLDLDPRARCVLADRTQLQQVLVSLMHNAIEAMEGSDLRRLTVSTRPVEAGMVEIAVADTGPGIPAEIAPDLFKSFVTTKPDGMGVGLSVCRTIIEAHGGRIWVAPNPEGGATFRFILPAAAAAREEGAERSVSAMRAG
ncbi:CHASE3 domain-containing protein [Siccirubricoccus sp. G192]|uniref:CHASE3 domain-containing protein n=1 Tax=Siccirubricoccus sp. G192 TaxID=2849651 RepID=UPI001C2C5CF9|nr:CHASE3 domain-containing protein [Siccirubricoccus sp. G192]MBV1796652.1 CHASE3 domain-containing protein [Siccirubricoccus sp. G192]